MKPCGGKINVRVDGRGGRFRRCGTGRSLGAGIPFHATKSLVKAINFSGMKLRSPEWQILDPLVPWTVGIGILGFLLSWLLMAMLERTGLTRFIGHVPLFFLGLLALITSRLGTFFHP
jgi:hypothetical protein